MAEKDAEGLELEVVPLTSLKPHPRNYRTHPEDQLVHLVQSIKENGVYRNVVVARDGTILAGHGVVQAAKLAGLDSIPVHRVDVEPESMQALKILVGDNEVEHLANQDDRALSEILKGIHDVDVAALLGTGYDEMMLANLVFVTRPESEIQNFDAASEWVGMPEFDTGGLKLQLSVQFREEEDRVDLLRRIGVEPEKVEKFGHGRTWSMWWPLREHDEDVSSVRFEEG